MRVRLNLRFLLKSSALNIISHTVFYYYYFFFLKNKNPGHLPVRLIYQYDFLLQRNIGLWLDLSPLYSTLPARRRLLCTSKRRGSSSIAEPSPAS
ncbi:hypothetical protein IMY05_013G0085500 [Salix suchowensis]|nr:hypothetical protein IMY05_013G0085500 [Salix suchowensis]